MYLKAFNNVVGAGAIVLALFFPQFSPAQTPGSTSSSAPASQSSQTSPPQKQKPSASSSSLPSAPSPAQSSQEPSLQDLGFSQQQMQSNPALQARLNRRTEMLKIHQRLGIITLVPMVAALITGPTVKVKGRDGQALKAPSSTNLDLHAALGSATTALYFTTAWYAIYAPGVPGEKKRGAIRMHEALALVHGPGMILTPVLGAMAFSQEQNGEKVHGIASAHGAVATVTALAYGASIVAVAWPIHLKSWEKR